MADLTFKPVTPASWDDFEALFQSPGAPKYCWCMAWRPLEGKRMEAGNAERKAAMAATVAAKTPVGLIAYDDGKPVAWVSIAPRDTYRSLGGPPAHDGERVWSLACMYAKRAYRGQGIAHALIEAAVGYARTKKATVVEAYPVNPDAPSYRFMGFVTAFKKAGFTDEGMAGTRRHLMRLPLT